MRTRVAVALISSIELFFQNTALPSIATEAAFPFETAQFQTLFNQRADAGGIDRIIALKPSGNDVVASLSDNQFQAGIAELKKMDVANGRFVFHLKIILTVNREKKVTQIIVEGSRSDPVNMLRTVGAVGAIYELLNPGAPQKSEDEFLAGLGLLRGDTDPTIGQPVSNFSKGGAFTCNSQSSDVSDAFGCVVVPRS